jgi:dimethylhistidine N-methyltransferase
MSVFQSSSSTPTSNAVGRSRLQLELLAAHEALNPVGADVVAGLSQTPKTLPPQYFYDNRGSLLFEEICQLPEYYPTRTEAAILNEQAEAIAHLTGPCELIELGSGSSTKTRRLLDAYQELGYPLHYRPVDVSGGILEASAQTLLADYPSLQVKGLIGTYDLALQQLVPTSLPARLIFFLGSSLGNFSAQECDAFLERIKLALQPGDYFLLGIDLQKPKAILEAAYNDAQGVTAAFNLNMLEHLNQRFQGDFVLEQFEHWAFFNEASSQIEMHLRSLRSQGVQLKALDLAVSFAEGESIRTEISRKFNLEDMKRHLQALGLLPLKLWTDKQQWFGLVLCQMF